MTYFHQIVLKKDKILEKWWKYERLFVHELYNWRIEKLESNKTVRDIPNSTKDVKTKIWKKKQLDVDS